VGNLDDVTRLTSDPISKWRSIDLEVSDDSDGDQEDPEQAFLKVALLYYYYSHIIVRVVL